MHGRSLARSVVRILLLLPISGCAGTQDEVGALISSQRSESPTGAVMLLQVGDCETRDRDVVLAARVLGIKQLFIISDGSDASVQTASARLRLSARMSRMSSRDAARLRQFGVRSTPAIIAWDSSAQLTILVSLASTRQELYRQLSTIKRLLASDGIR